MFSVDVDSELVDLTAERLTAIGYTLTLIARDGDQGLAEYAPYDRIIFTCAVPAFPRAWSQQAKEGDLILSDFKPSGMAGNLVLLERQGDTASGRFLPAWAGFMDMRHANPATKPRQPCRVHANAQVRRASAPLHGELGVWEEDPRVDGGEFEGACLHPAMPFVLAWLHGRDVAPGQPS